MEVDNEADNDEMETSDFGQAETIEITNSEQLQAGDHEIQKSTDEPPKEQASSTKAKGKGKPTTSKLVEEDVIKNVLSHDVLCPKLRKLLLDHPALKEWTSDSLDIALRLINTMFHKYTDLVCSESEVDNSKEEENLREALNSCLTFIRCLSEVHNLSVVKSLHSLAAYLSGCLLIKQFDSKFKETCSVNICEKYIICLDHVTKSAIATMIMIYLFESSVQKPTKQFKKIYTKRLWFVARQLPVLDATSDVHGSRLFNLLLLATTDQNFLLAKEGVQLIGRFIASYHVCAKDLQELIRSAIPGLPLKAAAKYGSVYFNAWNMATDAGKQNIEEFFIQDLIERALTLNRSSINQTPLGKKILSILSVLHYSRSTLLFSSAVTKCYAPFLWRSLNSPHPLERCNACELFMDVFPLEKPKAGRVKNLEFKEKQFDTMLRLLKDDSHLVRVLAINGVIRILCEPEPCFSKSELKEVVKILAAELVNDCSTYLVPKAVFDGFAIMIEANGSKTAAEIVRVVLPQLANHIHDSDEKVRLAFVNVLIKLKNTSNEKLQDFKYWDVVPFEKIFNQLCVEKNIVGQKIVELMFSDVYSPEQKLEKVVLRIKKLLKKYTKGAIHFFTLSGKNFTHSDVQRIIIALLTDLATRMKLKKKEASESLTKEAQNGDGTAPDSTVDESKSSDTSLHTPEPPCKKSCLPSSEGSTNVLTPEVIVQRKSASYNLQKEEQEFHEAILITICLLWMAKSETFKEPENAKMLETLQSAAATCIQPFLLYYKGTNVYYHVLNLASFVPMNLLIPVSTVSGVCVSELRNMTEETPDIALDTLFFCLSAWNRSSSVIELAMEWIDHAFSYRQLNASALMKPGKKSAKVRFQPRPCNPILGVRMIRHLFLYNEVSSRVMEKNYDQVYDLFVYLERIKKLLEIRFKDGEFSEPELSDKFLIDCYKCYLMLVPLLHRPELAPNASTSSVQLAPFSAPEFDVQLISWAMVTIYPELPTDENESAQELLAVQLLKDTLTSSTFLLSTNIGSKPLTHSVALYIFSLLKADLRRFFISPALDAICSLLEYCLAFDPDDEWKNLKLTGPKLYEALWQSIAVAKLNKANIRSVVQSKGTFTAKLKKIAKLLLSKSVDNGFSKSFIARASEICTFVISNVIREEDLVEPKKSLAEQPYVIVLLTDLIFGVPTLKSELLNGLINSSLQLKKDDIDLQAMISLAYTLYAVFLRKLDKNKFVIFLQTLYSKVTEGDKASKISYDLGGKKILMDLAKELGCSLRPGPLSREINSLSEGTKVSCVVDQDSSFQEVNALLKDGENEQSSNEEQFQAMENENPETGNDDSTDNDEEEGGGWKSATSVTSVTNVVTEVESSPFDAPPGQPNEEVTFRDVIDASLFTDEE